MNAMSETPLAAADALLLEQVTAGEAAPRRRAIAKTITLLESTRADHRLRADALLNALLPHSGRSFRLGISGVPGVGKSTFIEALGLHPISARVPEALSRTISGCSASAAALTRSSASTG